MSVRDKEVLNMQLVLIPIDICYENYNSTGNQGIIDDLQDYIEMQGGRIG